MKRLAVITWARWDRKDPIDGQYYVRFTISVLKPSYEYPLPMVTMSIVGSSSRLFMRFLSIEEVYSLFNVPKEYKERIEYGLEEAKEASKKIREHLTAIMKMGDLAPGGQVVRTDTGEIIAEAERIIKERGKQ